MITFNRNPPKPSETNPIPPKPTAACVRVCAWACAGFFARRPSLPSSRFSSQDDDRLLPTASTLRELFAYLLLNAACPLDHRGLAADHPDRHLATLQQLFDQR